MGTSVRPNGMASAAAALRYWERRQEVASNNLANVSTDGFKGEKVFATMIEGALPAAAAVTDFSQGTLQITNNPRDVALQGNGFFVVKTPNGERYTRGGTLRVNDAGDLTDASGNKILGDNGPIRVTSEGDDEVGNIQISRNGTVTVNNAEMGHLRIETIPPKTTLAAEGGGMFIPPAQRQRIDPDARIVRQGALEQSNVTPISEMVDMIAIQRSYTAVQQAVTSLDAARQIATTELARPAN